MERDNAKPIDVFFSYAIKDERFVIELEKHLSILKRQGLIMEWHDSKIDAGQEWEKESNDHLDNAEIVLLLISPDFMSSEYCYSHQMKHALDRHDQKKAIVIPVLLRSVDLEDTPLWKLKALPKNAIFVTRWRNRDAAFTDIAKGIRNVIKIFTKTTETQVTNTILRAIRCPNCSAPVFLPLACGKCGLFPIQVCNKCKRINTIYQETCQSCDAPLALLCNNCKAKNSLEVDFCGNCGFKIQQTCPECGEKNPADQENCRSCTVSLIQVCSHCNQANDNQAELCFRCGMPLWKVCITCDAINNIEDEICWRCNELLDIAYSLEIPLHLAQFFPS